MAAVYAYVLISATIAQPGLMQIGASCRVTQHRLIPGKKNKCSLILRRLPDAPGVESQQDSTGATLALLITEQGIREDWAGMSTEE